MKSRKILTIMTVVFAVVGLLLYVFDPEHGYSRMGEIALYSAILAFFCFIALLLSLARGNKD
jgi:F0F1-type ATP synthase assembly protein I